MGYENWKDPSWYIDILASGYTCCLVADYGGLGWAGLELATGNTKGAGIALGVSVAGRVGKWVINRVAPEAYVDPVTDAALDLEKRLERVKPRDEG
ncbi:hypothetical protein ACFL0V_04335 [Nanoarchaeota archaeon]